MWRMAGTLQATERHQKKGLVLDITVSLVKCRAVIECFASEQCTVAHCMLPNATPSNVWSDMPSPKEGVMHTLCSPTLCRRTCGTLCRAQGGCCTLCAVKRCAVKRVER